MGRHRQLTYSAFTDPSAMDNGNAYAISIDVFFVNGPDGETYCHLSRSTVLAGPLFFARPLQPRFLLQQILFRDSEHHAECVAHTLGIGVAWYARRGQRFIHDAIFLLRIFSTIPYSHLSSPSNNSSDACSISSRRPSLLFHTLPSEKATWPGSMSSRSM